MSKLPYLVAYVFSIRTATVSERSSNASSTVRERESSAAASGMPLSNGRGSDQGRDPLKQLLNLAVAVRTDKGDPVTAPGIPPDNPHPKSLITDDCMTP